jgi:energy-coupling factor transporter transmembrane protein EcfT
MTPPADHVAGQPPASLVLQLSPTGRVAVAALGALSVLTLDAGTVRGGAGVVIVVGAHCALTRAGARALTRAVGLALTLFVPWAALLLLGAAWNGSALNSPAVYLPAARLLATSTALLVLLSAWRHYVTASDLREALARAPVPPRVGAVLLQILQQVGTLRRETIATSQALLLRGSAGERRTQLGLLVAFPRAWVPRLIERAERVAQSLEVRGFDGRPLALRSERRHPRERWLILGALALFFGTLATRGWHQAAK